jgi:hypothetical protein
MQIVVTAFLDESLALMQESTRLVDLYQGGNPDFLAALKEWMRKAESMMKNHRRSQVGAVSALRAKVLAALSGSYEGAEPAGSRLHARKRTLGTCLLLLSQAQTALREVHASLEAKKEEASRLVQQILQILMQNGAMPAL